jgi:2-iminobutanoate/2-iminopropanoate deaminase
MSKKAVFAPGAVSIGPYSPAIESDKELYLSGQIPIDSKTGKLISTDIKEQTRQAFLNAFTILKNAGLTSDDVVKVNVYLTDMSNFTQINEVYKEQFNEPYPARTTLGVKELPLGALIEIEMIARRN